MSATIEKIHPIFENEDGFDIPPGLSQETISRRDAENLIDEINPYVEATQKTAKK